MDYYKFKDAGFGPLDVVETADGVVRVECTVIDGELMDYSNLDFDFDLDGDTGILVEDEDGEAEFISHSLVLGLYVRGS